MIQTLGKYRVIERIGRGGMGIVLKAHDPVLDRTVALKVISADVDVTDELRARFFREAQACARLTHPNIVTVFDLADVDGRLFIVMELLEGEELRQLIAQRRPMPLETKLSVMAQVCDGLGYAHQRGVVHRDIKPGNIFVLRNGVAKILDFGIARITSTDAALTRTGLIMGTLRYMAPEQAQGRSDHRSDIFAVGAVFYEFLAYRPAFPGDDPMEILEALRAQTPPRLSDLDPGIPPELADLIARAMHKDPAQRLADLAEMRRELEALRRRLIDAADELRRRVHPRLAQLRALQASLGERLGGSFADETIPVSVDDAGSLAALQAMDHDVLSRIDRLQPLLDRAVALQRSVDRGLERLDAGDPDAAVRELEPVVAELPEHVRAATALAQARASIAEREHRQRLSGLLADARAALARQAFAECLERLETLRQAGPPADIAVTARELADAARDAQAAKEAEERRLEMLRQERARAEDARVEVAKARRRGAAAGGPADAASTWNAAEGRAADAEASFTGERYGAAIVHFDAALGLYRRAEVEAQEVRRARARATAEAARDETATARSAAADLDAPTEATARWTSAVGLETRAAAALTDEDLELARSLFLQASTEYARAANEARDARQRRERESAEHGREEMERARGLARESGAAEHASQLLAVAEAARTAAEQAFAEAAYRVAAQRFDEARARYGQAADESRAVSRARQRALAEDARGRARAARRDAEGIDAAALAPERWMTAERTGRRADTVFGAAELTDEDVELARTLFLQAATEYARAAAEARDARQRRERQLAERGREEMERARRVAQESAAAEHASQLLALAEAARTEAEQAFAGDAYPVAAQRFDEARARFGRAAEESRAVILARQRVLAEEARGRARDARQNAEEAEGASLARERWTTAERTERRADAALEHGDFTEAHALFLDAGRGYDDARHVAVMEKISRERAQAEDSRDRMDECRRRADAIGAQTDAAPRWSAAEERRSEALRAFAEGGFRVAAERFHEAARLYTEAETATRAAREDAARRADALADQAARLLDAGQPADAGRVADEALAIVQDHATAAGVRSRAEQERREQAVTEQLLHDARAALAAGDTTRGIELLRRVRERNPRQAEAAQLLEVTQARLESERSRTSLVPAPPANEDSRTMLAADPEGTAVRPPASAGGAETHRRPLDRPPDDATHVRPDSDPTQRADLETQVSAVPARPVSSPAWIQRVRARAFERGPRRRTVTATVATLLLLLAGLSLGPEAVRRAKALFGLPGQAVQSRQPAREDSRREPSVDTDRGAVASVQADASSARAEAEGAGAERLAARPFGAAVEAQREGDAGMAKGDSAAARASYQRAAAEFRAATAEARKTAMDARKAQLAIARDAARRARAPELAGEPWTKAEATARHADQLVTAGDHAGAMTALTEAERLYQQAGTLAVQAGAEDKKAEQKRVAADGRRAETLKAREAATAIDARRHAAAVFDKASRHEQQANAAFAGRDYDAADRNYREARAGFEEARAIAQQRVDAERQRGDADRRRVEAERQRQEAERQRQEAERQQQEAERQRREVARAETAESAKRAESARRTAEQAGADRHAAAAMKSGHRAEADGQAALGRNDYDKARQAFRSAEAEYQQAAKVAEGYRDEIGRARTAAAGSRDAARTAGADSMAKTQFEAATAKWNQAESHAAGGTVSSAVRAFKEAEALYADAERRVKDAVRELESDARARREHARKAGADMLAKDVFDRAGGKHRDGDTLAKGENWVGAAQAYREATEGYGAAERRVGDIERVRGEAEAAKKLREQAVRVGAETLAKELFDAASGGHREADRLARSANVLAAVPVYRDAAERYGQAERRARELTELRAQADRARERMLAEKKRARATAPEFSRAVREETDGEAAYRRLAFAEAAYSFRSATELFGKAVAAAPATEVGGAAPSAQPPPGPPASTKAQGEIRAVLAEYSRAFETKDAALLRRVRPGLTGEELQRYRELWDGVSAFKVALDVDRIDVSGDEAQVTGRREDTVIYKDGRREAGAGQRSFKFKLKRGNAGWTIESVN